MRIGYVSSSGAPRPLTDVGSLPQPVSDAVMLRRSVLPACLLALGPGLGCNCDESGLQEVRPRLVLGAEEIDFGEVPVGELRIRSFLLQNKGQAPLELSTFELAAPTGEYLFATPVPSTLQIEEELDFNVVFEPADVGEELATITIDTNDGLGPRTVRLRGVGVMAGVAVTHDAPQCGDADRSVSFGQVTPGQTARETITVKASGSAPVTVFSAVIEPGTSPELAIEALAAPRILAPGEELALEVTYTPSDGGPDTGAFVITTDAASDPSIRIAACGEGVAPALCAEPLDFGRVAVGASATKPMTITSCGLQPVDLSALALANDAAHPSSPAYRLLNLPSLPRTLAPGETVTLDVELTPPALGPAQGWVQATSTAFGRPESYFSIYGEGGQPCGLQVLPSTLSFSNVAAGQTAQQALIVANSGASDCSVSRLEITAGAAQFRLAAATPPVPLLIPSGGSIQLGVEYSPSAGGTQDTGTLEVEESGAITPVTLLGNPVLAEGCQVEIVPPIVNFGVVPPGTTRSMALVVNNISDDLCTLRDVALDPSSSPDFTNTSPSFGIIIPGRSKTLSVTYRPTAAGAATGALLVTTSDVDTPTIQVPIFASSAPTGICVTPRVLAFGPTQGSATQMFNISACGTNAVTVHALDWTTPDTEISLMPAPSLPFTLQPGANQGVTVMYQSLDMQGDTAVLTVRSSDPAEPNIDVTVTGGPEIVPTSAGRFLYYWQIPSPLGGDIMQLPLQGNTTAIAWWGPRAGKQCSGCHSVSPDGRYVGVVELPNFRVIDTTTNIQLSTPFNQLGVAFMSWNPDVNTNPPYQFAYDNGSDVHIASLFDGYIGTLAGADDPAYFEQMPSWGPDGKIAFSRGAGQATGSGGQGTWGLNGPCDVMLVDEGGGTAVAVPGASGNGMGNYYPAYSRNGQWIAFTQSASAMSTIAATDAQMRLVKTDLSGTTRALTNANGTNGASSYPTWSVDGQFLSFSSNRSGGRGDWDIYIAPIDPVTGADQAAMNVTSANSSAFEHSAQWSP